MSKTNGQVLSAFASGHTAKGGNVESEFALGLTGVQLRSYGTVIAYRRERDGQVFVDGHRYSSTTSGKHTPSGPSVSFRCLDRLIGQAFDWPNTAMSDRSPREYWLNNAEVLDSLPHECPDNAPYRAHWATYWQRYKDGDYSQVGNFEKLKETEPPYVYCSHEPKPFQWSSWTLLRLPDFDVLCSGDIGRRERWSNNDQLWASILPARAETIQAAVDMLRPSGATADKRQGDLFFIPVDKKYDKYESFPLDRFPLAIPVGAEPYRHIVTRKENIVATYPLLEAGEVDTGVYVRSDIWHSQHKRLRLGSKVWHRVAQSLAVRSVSAPVGGGRAGDD
jgi:hypothetical protein